MEASADPDLRVFAYAVADKAALYVAIVDRLMAAKERFTLQLRPAEVARELGPGAEVTEVAVALEVLEDWGNVTKFYDMAAPDTLDQFYAKRFLYQLTESGVAAHEGVRAVRRAGLDTGRLSAVLLPGIQERLEAVRAEGKQDEPDGARLYNALIDLFATFATLADNAARYMQDLAVETSAIAADDERFVSYKRAVFVYLDEFVGHLAGAVPAIATLTTDLDADMPRLSGVAAQADTTPTAAGEDDALERLFAERWAGVRAWFVASGEAEPIVVSLRVAMLDAINRILAALDRLHERHLRRVTREADFAQLARWFAVADDAGAGLLWDRAFGLYPARHFAELAGDEAEERGRGFADAAPAEVAPRLRAAGTRASPGRPGRAADYSATKAAGLLRLRAERRRMEAAMDRLAARTPARLSELGALDADEFAQFLEVLTAALGARPDERGSRTAPTPLGSVTVRPFPKATGEARIVTPRGTFRCADRWLEVDLTGRARRQALA
ncbi:MAG: TIGR02677 family protein [Acidimicrobiales bacterium]